MTYTDFLKSLSKNERRFLSKFECAWCDFPLDKDGCSAVVGSGGLSRECSDETRINRAKKCLESYKPRQGISKVIESNKEKIFTSNYPASVASDILVNQFKYSYEYAKVKFERYCRKNNYLININNF